MSGHAARALYPPEELLVFTADTARKYLLNAPALAPLGESLIFRLSSAMILQFRRGFRGALPDAVLRPAPPGSGWGKGSPLAYPSGVGPMRAPGHFRQLPPLTRVPLVRVRNVLRRRWVGSGVSRTNHPRGAGLFTRCMHCAGASTRVVFLDESFRFDGVSCLVWEETEYVCLECGRTSWHRRHQREWLEDD